MDNATVTGLLIELKTSVAVLTERSENAEAIADNAEVDRKRILFEVAQIKSLSHDMIRLEAAMASHILEDKTIHDKVFKVEKIVDAAEKVHKTNLWWIGGIAGGVTIFLTIGVEVVKMAFAHH